MLLEGTLNGTDALESSFVVNTPLAWDSAVTVTLLDISFWRNEIYICTRTFT